MVHRVLSILLFEVASFLGCFIQHVLGLTLGIGLFVSLQSSGHERFDSQLPALSVQDNVAARHLAQQQAQPHQPQERAEERRGLEGSGSKVSHHCITLKGHALSSRAEPFLRASYLSNRIFNVQMMQDI